MADTQEIIVRIKGGRTRIEVRGVAGPACESLSAGIEAAVGVVTERTRTAEYHEEAAAATRVLER